MAKYYVMGNYTAQAFRGFIKDSIYRGSEIVTYPLKSFGNSAKFIESHLNLYKNYKKWYCGQF